MGVDIQTLRLLLLARQMGVDFERTITLGRQDLLMTAEQLRGAFESFGQTVNASAANQMLQGADRFADLVFKELGATALESMDASEFEGATIIHDLNRPLPTGLAGRFTLVFDGGTIEHVFDVPEALRGCMELAAPGGHVVMASPCNNLMGHGFYQFGPDLFHRVFAPENGFELRVLFMAPAFGDGQWYRVRDPAAVGSRIGHNYGARPLYLFAIARRIGQASPLMARTPQQSDYASEWAARPTKVSDTSRLSFYDDSLAELSREGAWRRLIRKVAPSRVRRLARSLRAARVAERPPDPAHFEPFSLPPSGDRTRL